MLTGRFEEAAAVCDSILAQNPDDVDALNTRGVVLSKLRLYPQALESYDAALTRAPDRVDIRVNRATSLLDLDRLDEALADFDDAVDRDPANVAALINRGNAFVRGKRFEEALASYDSALGINPNEASALTDRGVALAEMGRFDEALSCHEKALLIGPHVVAAHVNRGNAFLKLARLEEALASYDEALRLDPEQIEANFNSALTRLCLGDFRRGWKQYEYRWRKKHFEKQWRRYSQPVWRGERHLKGKRILLVHEQGLGDTLQFVRYAPLVADLGATVLLGVQPALKILLAQLPGIAQVIADGESLPDFDLFCPLLSLPLAFDTELATIPANVPYLWPYEERLAKWRDRLPKNGRLRIGICWAGSADHLNDRNRSLPIDRLASLFSVAGVEFVSLQKEVSAAASTILEAHGVLQVGREFEDFADTAAVVSLLDLVISVDTSVAHLAGAMGKATALLVPFSPDWRWFLHRTDSPWYPTMRLFRQLATGDWDTPLARLQQELVDVSRRPLKRR